MIFVVMSSPVLLSWSGGKDSALALQALSADSSYRVVGLVTAVTAGYDRISIHGVRRALLESQAASLGLPLHVFELQPGCSNDDYEKAFHSGLARAGAANPGCSNLAFGDLFLEDVRAYRERLLSDSPWTPVFPLWGLDTPALARRFVDDGFRARLVCVDTTQLDGSYAGREFDHAMLDSLPVGTDPCGERGEFHTFVSNGPGFATPVAYTTGERVLRDGRFMYCDLTVSRAGHPERSEGNTLGLAQPDNG
jgi:uncharacterized protein (TIGR00290 family)